MRQDGGINLQIREIGSFHVGGKQVSLSGLPAFEGTFAKGGASRKVDPNGDFETGQMYVHYSRLTNPKNNYPLLLWHGGGLSGVTWETKPDGNSGWQMFFLRAGYDVYVSDAVERGRASWSRYPEVYTTDPVFRTKKEAWESFRIGSSYATLPEKRLAYEETRFPIHAFDQFMKQAVPRWSSNDDAIQAAYDALLQKVGPGIIIVHSQGGAFAEKAALNAPDKVKAIVFLEPSGMPDPLVENLSSLKDIPHLYVWADYIDKYSTWPKYYANVARYRDALKNAGAPVTWIELPQIGITGNSHMLMMDNNSDDIAAIVENWLQTNIH